ncbi:ComE operon protein 3 [bacterium HR34]|nr:ComE operon protein 3 [bacterium HR34]
MKLSVLLYVLIFLISANLAVIKVFVDLKDYNQFTVYFFDVGQGDAILIKTPYLQNIIIDAGPSAQVLSDKLTKNIPFWMKRIDLFLATHPEYDHIGGVKAFFDDYKVLNVLRSGLKKETKTFEIFTEYITKAKNVSIAQKGTKVFLDSNKTNYFKILWPKENLNNVFVKSTNDYSIVFLARLSSKKFLFTADISSKIEKELIKEDIKSDILKVPHHGSKFSSSSEFLDKVSPYFAVIMAGKGNRYNHPHQETLKRLEERNIKVLRTDLMGDIVFRF